jgi:hypothetical protein
VWLAQCEAQPEPYRWSCDKLEARMMDILDELETCMRNKRLPMYFDNAVNLLQTADCGELHQLEEKISRLSRQRTTSFDKCHKEACRSCVTFLLHIIGLSWSADCIEINVDTNFYHL